MESKQEQFKRLIEARYQAKVAEFAKLGIPKEAISGYNVADAKHISEVMQISDDERRVLEKEYFAIDESKCSLYFETRGH